MWPAPFFCVIVFARLGCVFNSFSSCYGERERDGDNEGKRGIY